MFKRSIWLVLAGLVGVIVAFPSAALGGGCHPPDHLKLTTSTETTMGIGQCAFQNTVTYVDAGSKVTWINKDQVPHTVTGAAGSWGNEDYMQYAERVTYTFSKPGVFPYYCVLHPSMVGAVVVGDAPPTDVSAGSGISELDDAAAASASTDAPPPTDDSLDLEVVALGVLGILGAAAALVRFRSRSSVA